MEELASSGSHVVALGRYALPAYVTEEFQRRYGCVNFEVGDVRDGLRLERICQRQGVETIVHAATITADAGRESRIPDEITSVNVLGTVSVLQAARALQCRRVVYVGSGQAYGLTHRDGKLIEEERSPSRPEELYGITKLAAEQIALRLGEVWKLDVVAVRLGSVCGPWEFDTGDRDTLSPQLRIARMAVRGEEAILPKRESWRDWVYSRDVARGLAAAVHVPACRHRVYHLTSGLNWKDHLLRWCDTLQVAYPKFSWHVASELETQNVDHVVRRDRAPMSTARIKADLNFEAKFGPAEAYDDYIAWLREHERFIV